MRRETNRVSDAQIGERLRIARERADLTQAQAADLIDVARTTIVAIEQGKRSARIGEIQVLAGAYGTAANAILRNESIRVDLIPQFRKLPESSSERSMDAARQLQDLVSAEVELESALGVSRQHSYPRETPLLPGDVAVQAEHDATELRRFLGIGNGPIFDIIGLLELQLGFRVYVRPLDSKVSGLFAYDQRVGACMLLNSNHRAERLRLSAAHETGHFSGSRQSPQVDSDFVRSSTREERYANSFAYAFLMPSQSVKGLFAEVTAGQSHFIRKHIILMAHHFGVSREALVRRLEDLKIIKPKTWEWFSDNGGITDEQVAEVVGNNDPNFEPSRSLVGLVPRRLSLLAIEAYKKGLYSEGQLAQLLAIDRQDVREILADADDEAMEADDFVKIVR